MPSVWPARLACENIERVRGADEKCDSRPFTQENQTETHDEYEEVNEWSIWPKAMFRRGIDQQEYASQRFQHKETAGQAKQDDPSQLQTWSHLGLTKTSSATADGTELC